MSKFLKTIVNIILIGSILVSAGLLIPPFLGVTTVIVDDLDMETNLPIGSVTYGVEKKASELKVGDKVLMTELGKAEYKEVQKKIAEDSLTLVKYKDKDVLPITPDRYKRIMIVRLKPAAGPMDFLMEAMGYGGGKNPAEVLCEKLNEKGFEAFIYESPVDKMKKQIAEGQKPSIDLYFAGKNAIADFVKDMDLVLTVCDVANGRPAFGLSKGGGEIPWYVFEVPVVVVGVGAPTMLADLPQSRTYINAYDSKEFTMDALVEQLMTGPEAFKGQDPIDSFCGLFDSHL